MRRPLPAYSGRPVREPVAFGSPFLTSTGAENQQAFADFRAGLFGAIPDDPTPTDAATRAACGADYRAAASSSSRSSGASIAGASASPQRGHSSNGRSQASSRSLPSGSDR